jgi:hypothetical protein
MKERRFEYSRNAFSFISSRIGGVWRISETRESGLAQSGMGGWKEVPKGDNRNLRLGIGKTSVNEEVNRVDK